MANGGQALREKLLATAIAIFAFYYFIWPDSVESCIKKAAKDAGSSYGFRMLAEICTRSTWVDEIKDIFTSTKNTQKGLKPFNGELDPPKPTVDQILGDPPKSVIDDFLDKK